MSESMKQFLRGLPICAVFALVAAVATLLFRGASDYSTHFSAVRLYLIIWGAACALSFFCGLLLVPRSPGVIFAFAGVLAFAILCAMTPSDLQAVGIAGTIVQALPALFFLFAWAFITLSTYGSDNKKVRLSSWLWLTVFLTLAASWGVIHYARAELLKQRNLHLVEARSKTLLLVEKLKQSQQDNGAYPETLTAAGFDPKTQQLSYRGKRILYFGHDDDFVLTFEDPMIGNQKAFSYDTEQGGWFPEDPQDALDDRPTHIFLGFLRK